MTMLYFLIPLEKHMVANTLVRHNSKYFHVAKEDAQVCNFVNTATGCGGDSSLPGSEMQQKHARF